MVCNGRLVLNHMLEHLNNATFYLYQASDKKNQLEVDEKIADYYHVLLGGPRVCGAEARRRTRTGCRDQ